MTASISITPEEMAVYRKTAQQRTARLQQALQAHRARAWELARQAADLLRHQYGADFIMLFGSLARNELISTKSDVDLAVWGLEGALYYRVVSHLLDLDPPISIDLVRAEEAPTTLLEVIHREGIVL